MEQNLEYIVGNLNEEQKKAVEFMNGPLLVVAGAGTGKTKVLTHRVAHLIAKGVKPWNILTLTFTNKAAGEMTGRIANLVGEDRAAQIYSGTFHSVFAKILRIEAETIGYKNSFTIYDSDDQLSLIRRIMRDLGIAPSKYNGKEMQWKISNAKNELITAGEFQDKAMTVIDKQAAIIYKEYEKMLITSNAMDFDDLLVNFIYLMQKSKAILEKYQTRFKYILVDEYQDTNRAQYIAINLLAKAHQNLCVVGDDAQSIYRWRGADIRNILDFRIDYPHTQTIRLEKNYRSTKNILGAANSVIGYNKEQIPKTLYTDNPQGELVDILRFDNDINEAQHIVTLVQQNRSSDTPWSDFAVLYRTNAQAMILENAFRKLNIPYQIIGGMSFYKRKEIKDVTAYLRLLINPVDQEALIRAINEPPRGLGTTSLQHIYDHANRNFMPLFEAFEKADNISALQKRASEKAKEFAAFVNKYRGLLETESISSVIEQYLEESGLTKMYLELDTHDSRDRLNNINEFVSGIDTFFAINPELTLLDYLQSVSLSSDYEEKDFTQDSVKLMTLHSAKGLEFPFIFISGMVKGLLPMERQDEAADIEEERRLMYVGMTRAKEKLYLTYHQKRWHYGEMKFTTKSPFLAEIAEEFLRRNDKVLEPIKLPKPPNVHAEHFEQKFFIDDITEHSDDYSQLPPTNQHLKVGDRVLHSKFGKGKIVSINGVGQFQKAIVFFDLAGRKPLMMQYAKLEKI